MTDPTFERIMYVGLSVTDVRRSAAWYHDVLGFETERENVAGEAWPSAWDEILLRHPHSGVRIGLLRHPTNDGEPFSEFRTGLDHVELEVASTEELERWRRRLDTAGVPHSGARDYIVTFRDPDNIQLELFCEPAT